MSATCRNMSRDKDIGTQFWRRHDKDICILVKKHSTIVQAWLENNSSTINDEVAGKGHLFQYHVHEVNND
eukprot:scaffold82142_cov43-Cyclotella_meneghiniana.AAC.3